MPVQYDTSADPTQYTSAEQKMVDAINAAGERNDNTLKSIAFGLGAAFILYRIYMQRRLKEEIAKEPRYLNSTDALTDLATRVSSKYVAKWIPTLAINLAVGYAQGLNEVRLGADPEWAKQASLAYAKSLGSGINDTSVQAFVEGIQGQVNRGVPMRVAVDRTIDAFGVAPRTMKSLVSLWTKKPTPKTTARATKMSIGDIIDSRIARAIDERAKVIGETESYLSMNAAKAMYWAYQAENGDLPATAEKEWITADDERTCAVCAPLHRTRVLVSEKFPSSIGFIMAPGVHPRCRCELRLHLNLDFSDLGSSNRLVMKRIPIRKDRGGDLFNRDAQGQFAARESRAASKPQARFRVYGQTAEHNDAPHKEREVHENPFASSDAFQSMSLGNDDFKGSDFKSTDIGQDSDRLGVSEDSLRSAFEATEGMREAVMVSKMNLGASFQDAMRLTTASLNMDAAWLAQGMETDSEMTDAIMDLAEQSQAQNIHFFTAIDGFGGVDGGTQIIGRGTIQAGFDAAREKYVRTLGEDFSSGDVAAKVKHQRVALPPDMRYVEDLSPAEEDQVDYLDIYGDEPTAADLDTIERTEAREKALEEHRDREIRAMKEYNHGVKDHFAVPHDGHIFYVPEDFFRMALLDGYDGEERNYTVDIGPSGRGYLSAEGTREVTSRQIVEMFGKEGKQLVEVANDHRPIPMLSTMDEDERVDEYFDQRERLADRVAEMQDNIWDPTWKRSMFFADGHGNLLEFEAEFEEIEDANEPDVTTKGH